VTINIAPITMGRTIPDVAALVADLQTRKSYVPDHQAAAQALAAIPACRARTVELLNDIADVARGAVGDRARLVLERHLSSATTEVWQLAP
jgi:hypothetical protein